MSDLASINGQSRVGSQLDDLLVSRFLPARWACRIWSASELSCRLERRVRNLPRGSEWRAYSDEARIFCAIARPRTHELRVDAGASLEVFFLDANAAVYAAGVWEFNREDGWWLDAVVELSYDCDQGWWVDGVFEPGAPSVKPESKRLTYDSGFIANVVCNPKTVQKPRRSKALHP